VLDTLRRALEAEPCVANALLFGSRARGMARPESDLDVAVELIGGAARDAAALGGLTARLESAVQHTVNLVLLDEAPPGLAYRIYRDGGLLLERDHASLVRRKARAILDYLDFKPVEDLCTEGVLRAAAARGR
jgi:hypothetical protein